MTSDRYALLDVYQIRADDHPVVSRAFSEMSVGAERDLLAVGPLPVLDAAAYTAFFWSPRTPGTLNVHLFDVVDAIRDARLPVIGSFQSELEDTWRRTIISAGQQVITCPSRDIFNMRLPVIEILNEERAMVITPRSFALRKPSAAMRKERDELIAAIAEQVFIAHAPPRSAMELLARHLLARGKPVFVLNAPENAELLVLGAKGVSAEDVAAGVMAMPHTPAPGNHRLSQPKGMPSANAQFARAHSWCRIDAAEQLSEYDVRPTPPAGFLGSSRELGDSHWC